MSMGASSFLEIFGSLLEELDPVAIENDITSKYCPLLVCNRGYHLLMELWAEAIRLEPDGTAKLDDVCLFEFIRL